MDSCTWSTARKYCECFALFRLSGLNSRVMHRQTFINCVKAFWQKVMPYKEGDSLQVDIKIA